MQENVSEEQQQLWVEPATVGEGLSASTYNRIMFKLDSASLTLTLIVGAAVILTYTLLASDDEEEISLLKIMLLSSMWAAVASAVNVSITKLLERCSKGARYSTQRQEKGCCDLAPIAKTMGMGLAAGITAGVATALSMSNPKASGVDLLPVTAMAGAALAAQLTQGYLRKRSNQQSKRTLEAINLGAVVVPVVEAVGKQAATYGAMGDKTKGASPLSSASPAPPQHPAPSSQSAVSPPLSPIESPLAFHDAAESPDPFADQQLLTPSNIVSVTVSTRLQSFSPAAVRAATIARGLPSSGQSRSNNGPGLN